jgi:hypothetical protein
MFDHSFDPHNVSLLSCAHKSYPTIITPSELADEKNEVDTMKKYEQYLNKYEEDLIPSSQTLDKTINTRNIFDKIPINKERESEKEKEKEKEDLIPQDIDFLKNVIRIKVKIDSLNRELNEIYEKNKNLKDYTDELEELKKMIHQCNESVDTCNDKYNGLVTRKYNDALMEHVLCSGIVKYEEAEDYASQKTNIQKTAIGRLPNLLNKENMNQINSINVILEKNKAKYGEAEHKICEIVEKIKMLKKIICTDDNTEKKDSSPKILCSVCNEKNIEFCMDTCGHCVCKDCSKKSLNKCHTCKANVNNKIKLNTNQFQENPKCPTSIGFTKNVDHISNIHSGSYWT